jgi:hypothetical protein
MDHRVSIRWKDMILPLRFRTTVTSRTLDES